MGILEILTYPNPRLREVSTPVDVFDGKLKKLTDDMIETMYHAHGIGLAAPQVGVLKRVVVIDTRPKDEEGSRYDIEEMGELERKVTQPLILINPIGHISCSLMNIIQISMKRKQLWIGLQKLRPSSSWALPIQ